MSTKNISFKVLCFVKIFHKSIFCNPYNFWNKDIPCKCYKKIARRKWNTLNQFSIEFVGDYNLWGLNLTCFKIKLKANCDIYDLMRCKITLILSTHLPWSFFPTHKTDPSFRYLLILLSIRDHENFILKILKNILWVVSVFSI